MQSLMPPINTADGLFQNGNPLTGVRGTVVTADWLNDAQSAIRSVQVELLSILAAAGIEVDESVNNQLLTALQQLFDVSDKQDKSANLTALSGLAGLANKLPYFTGAGAMAVSDLTLVARALLSKATIADMLTYLTAAPLASPTFTGTPKGPTAVAGDNSKQFATTEFVAAALTALLPKRSFSSNDFIRIPDVSGGLLIQWGTGTTASTGVTCTFATPFGTPLICVTSANQTSDVNTTYQGLNTSAVFIQAYNTAGALISGTSVRYIAIGVSP